MNNTQTDNRALEQSVYKFLVSKTNNNIVFEIKSYLGYGANDVSGCVGNDCVERRLNSAPASTDADEDEILRQRCRTRKWSI